MDGCVVTLISSRTMLVAACKSFNLTIPSPTLLAAFSPCTGTSLLGRIAGFLSTMSCPAVIPDASVDIF